MNTNNNDELEWFADFVDGIFGLDGEHALEREAEKRLHQCLEDLKKNPSMSGSLAEAVLEWWLHR